MKTGLLLPFPRKLALSIAVTVAGITDRLMMLTRGMASVKVGKQLGNVFPFLWGGFGVLKGFVV